VCALLCVFCVSAPARGVTALTRWFCAETAEPEEEEQEEEEEPATERKRLGDGDASSIIESHDY